MKPRPTSGPPALAAALIALAALPTLAHAQPPASAPALRTVDAILADYEKAVGGMAAWERHKSIRLKRDILVKGMQLQGTEERYQTAAGKVLVAMQMPGMGTFRQGSTGRAHWSDDPINGLRVLSGAEAEEMRIEGTWNADLKIKKLFSRVTAVAPPEPAKQGQNLECLQMESKIIRPVITCFDAETHLRVFQKGTHATAQGDVPYSAAFSDWRPVAGSLKMPYLEELTAGPMTLEARTVEVVFDQPVADSLFQMPKPGGADTKAAARPKPATGK